MQNRRKTINFKIGNVGIGSEYPVSVQSMTNTDTRNVEKTVAQIKALEQEGCELVRVAVLDMEAAIAIRKIKPQIRIPLIGDIHFDYRLALECINSGIDALRINPGNIGSEKKVKEVVAAAKDSQIPIRIGVNSGSLEKGILEKYGKPTADGMVESALSHIDLLENENFSMIKVSLKSSNVPMMIEAYTKLAEKIPYPLHLGVTEAGTENTGTIKSAVGIGSLLALGIGDTIRVSLTGDPLPEIRVGFEILKTVGLRTKGVELISCPTCGRCQIDLAQIANKVEEVTRNFDKPIKIAVMGCVVNGPGEAKEADLGIAGGNGEGLIFKKGKVIKKVSEENLLICLLEEINNYQK